MEHTLVIVESPTKAKTIRRFLPSNYEVLASMGHVRDLPKGAGEIPASLKKEKWSRIGVNTTEDFEPLYVVPKDKKKVVKDLKNALKGATKLVEQIASNPKAVIVGYKMTDGRSIGLILKFDSGQENWFFPEEIERG